MTESPFSTRRRFLQLGAQSTIGTVALLSQWHGWLQPVRAAELPQTSTDLDPDTALQRLLAGNQRFVQQRLQHPHQAQSRLQEVAQAQHPFATILSCADSRVPAEILFDQGIGDLFDVRIAGNIATPAAIGSIEYAVALLGTPVLMVVGHERCGAVTAAVQQNDLPGNMNQFVKAILPAVERSKTIVGDAVDNAVIANVAYQIEQLQRSPLLTERMRSGQLKLVGARYDLDTGSVKLLA
jgi:carbonic anhydrase